MNMTLAIIIAAAGFAYGLGMALVWCLAAAAKLGDAAMLDALADREEKARD